MNGSARSSPNDSSFDAARKLHIGGDLAGAEARYREALAKNDHHAGAVYNLGLLLAQQNRYDEAEGLLRRAVQLEPASQGALFHLARLLHLLKRPEEAVIFYKRRLDAGPATVEVLRNYARSCRAINKLQEAAELLQQSIALDPRDVPTLLDLGVILRTLGKTDAALAAYEEAARLRPDMPEPLLSIAYLHQQLERLIKPLQYYRRALELRPGMRDVLSVVAHMHEQCGEIDEAVAVRMSMLQAVPDDDELHRNLVTSLNFADGDDGHRVLATSRDWYRRFAAPLVAGRPSLRNMRDPERRLKIAYVGGDQFCAHTLAVTVLPMMEAQDRGQVEYFVYSDLAEDREDQMSRRYMQVSTWRRTRGMTDEALADLIRRDGIDVILDPLGFAPGSRLLTLARRPAPLQFAFPPMGTSGGDAIDGVIADRNLVEDEAQDIFAEPLIRIPYSHCFHPLLDPPPITPLPARLAGGRVTFGSMNMLSKLSPRVIRAWARILDQVPNSRLLVKAGRPFKDEDLRQRFVGHLAALGVDPTRVELLQWVPGYLNHLAVFNQFDIALDSFPYGGVTTTYEALAMGVPVVLRAGRRLLERYGVTILRTAGFEDGVTRTDDEYVARAVALAGDLDRVEELRRTLRGKLNGSLCTDAAAVELSLERVIREKWREWCAQQTPGRI